MNYSQIIKRGWEILKNNKFLWGLGILAGLVSGGGGISSFSFPSNFHSTQPTPATIQTSPIASPVSHDVDLSMASVGRVLGEVVDKSGEAKKSPPSAKVVVIGIIIGLFVLYFFGISARAGLILAVDKLETSGEKMGFKKSLWEGKKYFWRILGSELLFLAYFLVFMVICVVLIGIAILFNNTATIITIVAFGAVLFFVFLVSCLYLGILYLFVAQIIVLENFGPIKAIKKAHLLVKGNWRDVLISWVIMIGIGFAVGLAIFLVLLFLGVTLVLIGFGIYSLAGMAGVIIFGTTVGMLLLVVLLIIRGFVTAYMSIFATLVYRALRYLQAQKAV